MDQNSNDNICRICLNVQDTLFSLYRKRQGTSPYEKLLSRTKLNIQLNDAGPPSICSQCLIDLDTTVSFLDKCERSNRLLGARLARGIEEENLKAEGIETEAKVLHEVVPGRVLDEEVQGRAERCGECGARRRCRHRAPPALHTCLYCQRVFNKKYNYQIHVKRHLGESEFSCGVCGARLGTRWAAARHCRAPRRRACPAPGCTKTFTTNTNLRTHIRKHNGEKPFECDDCGKSFISKNILNNHMRIHTGVKPYMCQICGKQFTTNKLSSHLVSHGVAAGRTPHACPRAACARAFRSARALRAHARAHLPSPAPAPAAPSPGHACSLCDSTYKFKQSLNYHVKNVHGVNAKTSIRPDTSSIVSPVASTVTYSVPVL